jgi:hypothetical protein
VVRCSRPPRSTSPTTTTASSSASRSNTSPEPGIRRGRRLPVRQSPTGVGHAFPRVGLGLTD